MRPDRGGKSVGIRANAVLQAHCGNRRIVAPAIVRNALNEGVPLFVILLVGVL